MEENKPISQIKKNEISKTLSSLEEKQENFLACLDILQSLRDRKKRMSIENNNYVLEQDPLALPPDIQSKEWDEVKILYRQIQDLIGMINNEPTNVALIVQLEQLYATINSKILGLKFISEEIDQMVAEKVFKKRIRRKRAGMICKKCGTKDSPEWRKGPNKEDYCNACGLKYKKELKKNQEKKT